LVAILQSVIPCDFALRRMNFVTAIAARNGGSADLLSL